MWNGADIVRVRWKWRLDRWEFGGISWRYYIASYRPDKKLIHKPLGKPIPSKTEDYIFPFPFSPSTKTTHISNTSTAIFPKAQAAKPCSTKGRHGSKINRVRKKWLRKKFQNLVNSSLVLRRDIAYVLAVVLHWWPGGFGRRRRWMKAAFLAFRCHSWQLVAQAAKDRGVLVATYDGRSDCRFGLVGKNLFWTGIPRFGNPRGNCPL